MVYGLVWLLPRHGGGTAHRQSHVGQLPGVPGPGNCPLCPFRRFAGIFPCPDEKGPPARIPLPLRPERGEHPAGGQGRAGAGG